MITEEQKTSVKGAVTGAASQGNCCPMVGGKKCKKCQAVAQKTLKMCRKCVEAALHLTGARDQQCKCCRQGEEECLPTIDHQEVTECKCKEKLKDLLSPSTGELEQLPSSSEEHRKYKCTVFTNKQVGILCCCSILIQDCTIYEL